MAPIAIFAALNKALLFVLGAIVGGNAVLTLGFGFATVGVDSVCGDVAGGDVGADDVGADVGDDTEPGPELKPRVGFPLVEREGLREGVREGVREESEGLGWGLLEDVDDGGRWIVVGRDGVEVEGGFIELRDEDRDWVVCSRT